MMTHIEISSKIQCLDINDCYRREVFGLGEVYEIMAVEKLRKKLLKKFSQGTLFLVSNKNHNDKGLTLRDLEKQLNLSDFEVLSKGYTDSPPWSSKPLEKDKRKSYNSIIINLAKLIFFCLIQLEGWWESPERSHMIYCLAKKL